MTDEEAQLPYHTVCIVGSSPETRALAPFNDPSIDIWVFNEAYSQFHDLPDGDPRKWCKRADAVFQLHDPAVYRSPHNRSDRRHWEWLQQDHGELVVWMKDKDPDVPNAKRLPIEALHALLDEFRHGQGLERRKYLTSTVAIAIALAIRMAYDKIILYGVEMASDTEYQYQRECVLFWLGYAVGQGIQVDMVSGESMFNRPVYAYEGSLTTDIDAFDKRLLELNNEITRARVQVRDADERLERWQTSDVFDAVEEAATAQSLLGQLEGAAYEIERYKYKAQEMAANGPPYIDRNEYEGAAAQAARDTEQFYPEVYRTAGHVDLMLQSWIMSRNPMHLEQSKTFIKKHLDASYNNGRAKGIYQENSRLAAECDRQLKAAGGVKAVQYAASQVVPA